MAVLRRTPRSSPHFGQDMAAEIVWLDQALDDLNELSDYLEPLNPRAASAYADAIWSACERLAGFPRRGRMFADEFRLIVVRNHLVFYQYDQTRDRIEIVRVVDGRRDYPRLLDLPPTTEPD